MMFKEQFGGGWGSGLIPGIRNNPNIETDDQVEKCQHELRTSDWLSGKTESGRLPRANRDSTNTT